MSGCRQRVEGRAEVRSARREILFRFRGDRLGLGDPAVDALRQSDFVADFRSGCGLEIGELPEMEDAEIVELLLDRRRHMRELLQIVGNAARSGQSLELVVLRQILNDRRRRGADIDAAFACEREMPSIAALAIRSQ